MEPSSSLFVVVFGRMVAHHSSVPQDISSESAGFCIRLEGPCLSQQRFYAQLVTGIMSRPSSDCLVVGTALSKDEQCRRMLQLPFCLERESTGVEVAYGCTRCNFLTSNIRNKDSLANLKVMRIVFGDIEWCHSRSNRHYHSVIDLYSTGSSVHPVETPIPKDLISTYDAVALVAEGPSPKLFSS
jgi:hypothetical protein